MCSNFCHILAVFKEHVPISFTTESIIGPLRSYNQYKNQQSPYQISLQVTNAELAKSLAREQWNLEVQVCCVSSSIFVSLCQLLTVYLVIPFQFLLVPQIIVCNFCVDHILYVWPKQSVVVSNLYTVKSLHYQKYSLLSLHNLFLYKLNQAVH
jgi:hypothetical protein